MWAEKDRIKEGDLVRHSLSGEVALVTSHWFGHGFNALSVANTPKCFINQFVIECDEYWDVLE